MKVLVVTGSSRGIGAEICRRAASEGSKVCINYSRSEDEADAVVAQIREQGGIAIAVKADVSKEDEVIAMFERIGWKFERWHDVGYWQLSLGEDAPPGKIKPVCEVVE